MALALSTLACALGKGCLLAGGLGAFSSCRTMQQPVVVREVRTEQVHDTIRSRDSIYIDRWHTIREKGDTVYITDSTSRVEHHTTDRTTDIARVDSIPYEVEVPVEVPYVPPFYRNCTIGFWLLLLIIAGSIAIRALVKYIKYRARMPTIR